MTRQDIKQRIARMMHHHAQGLSRGQSIAPPLVQASTYYLPGEPEGPYQYGRFGQPTWAAVEAQLAILEEAEVISFPSGMAAVSAVLYTQLKAGDTVIVPTDGYYTIRALLETYLQPFQVEMISWPTADMLNAPFDKASLVWIETPCNPLLDVCDITKVAERAHAAEALLVADNTTMTAMLQQPLDLGADIIIAADTKAPAGHSDTLFGHVATRHEGIAEDIRQWRKYSGVIPGAMDAWLTYRGLKTLEVRLERMCASALEIATRLQAHPAVGEVRYPGLAGDPSHAIASQQMIDYGSLVGMTLASEDVAEQFIEACDLLVPATSFGSVQSSAERRARWGDDVAPGFVRLSIGCEPVEALCAAIEKALSRLAK
jgi:cystathionine gamma-lyase